MIKLENCPICKESEWKSLEYLRDKWVWYINNMRDDGEDTGFKICKTCGFVTYDYKDISELENHYDGERKLMKSANIVTCNRKNEYHKKFLSDIFTNNEKIKNSNILDVGCAQGSFLNMLHDEYGIDKEKLHGTEWSTAFADFGKYEYGINITKEIDESKKYGFISFYHVLEHVQSPDEMLEKIYNLLDDDGYLYIAVPIYIDRLEEASGSVANNFENLYHLNHVNCFSYQAIVNILWSNGFEVVDYDGIMYGNTFLCKKSCKKEIVKEDYKNVFKTLENQKKAIELFNAQKYQEAIEIIPEYPDAYIYMMGTRENMKDFKMLDHICNSALEIMQDNVKILTQYAHMLFQWDENKPDKRKFYGNNIKKSEQIFKKVFEMKPGSEETLYYLAFIAGNYRNEYTTAVELLKKALAINPMRFAEYYDNISYFYSEHGKLSKFI